MALKTDLCDDGYSRKTKGKSTSSWSVPRCYERLPPQDRGTKSLHFDSRLKETKLNLRPTTSKAISKNLLKHSIACNEQNRGARLNSADLYLYFLRGTLLVIKQRRIGNESQVTSAMTAM